MEKHKIHENNAKFMKLSQSSGGRHRTTRQNRIAHITKSTKINKSILFTFKDQIQNCKTILPS